MWICLLVAIFVCGHCMCVCVHSQVDGPQLQRRSYTICGANSRRDLENSFQTSVSSHDSDNTPEREVTSHGSGKVKTEKQEPGSTNEGTVTQGSGSNKGTGSQGPGSSKGGTKSQGPGSDKGGTESQGPGSYKGVTESQGPGSDKGVIESQGPGSDKGVIESQGPGSDKGVTESQGLGSDKGVIESQGPGSDKGVIESQGPGSDKGVIESQGPGLDKGVTESQGPGSDKKRSEVQGTGSLKQPVPTGTELDYLTRETRHMAVADRSRSATPTPAISIQPGLEWTAGMLTGPESAVVTSDTILTRARGSITTSSVLFTSDDDSIDGIEEGEREQDPAFADSPDDEEGRDTSETGTKKGGGADEGMAEAQISPVDDDKV